jgi:3-deoxy-D-manno-octulosonic acid kinase
VLREAAGAVDDVLRGGTLYDFAAGHPEARPLMGRAPAYAVPLPGGAGRVVVRHSRHGGLLAPLTGDRFLAPTRAPRELATALRLAHAGVPTPELVAYALYPAGPLLRTADVATREVEGGRDLAAALAGDLAGLGADSTTAALTAVAELLRHLAAAGARHPDLNVKNILLGPARAGAPRAYVLDVDRVTFEAPHSPRLAAANFARLARSLRKLADRFPPGASDEAVAYLAGRGRAGAVARAHG